MAYLISIMMMIAWVWLIVIAFKNDQTIWGIAMIIFFPSCYVYALINWRENKALVLFLFISTALIFTLSPDQIAKLKR